MIIVIIIHVFLKTLLRIWKFLRAFIYCKPYHLFLSVKNLFCFDCFSMNENDCYIIKNKYVVLLNLLLLHGSIQFIHI